MEFTSDHHTAAIDALNFAWGACAGEHYATADVSPEALIDMARWLIERDRWAERVHGVLAGLDQAGEYLQTDYASTYARGSGDGDPLPMCEGSYSLHPGAHPQETRVPGLAMRHLHLTVVPFAGERERVKLALIGAGLVDGWDGPDAEFCEAFSAYGWISVR